MPPQLVHCATLTAVAMHIGHAMPPVKFANFFGCVRHHGRQLDAIASIHRVLQICVAILHPIAEIAWNDSGHERDCVASVGWRKPLSDPQTYHNVSPDVEQKP